MTHAFGIDLGTTNSCIAVKTSGSPAQIIPLADKKLTLPSCVMYKDGEVIVGYEAYKHRFDTKHVVYSSKRDIGSDKVYEVYANGDDQPPINVTPVDVACEILKRLKHDAELLYGEGYVHDVTITVPAYFTGDRRSATLEAAARAGLNVLALINEPTSAAIAYTEGKSDNENILVYDLGGGTFDVTLLTMMKPDSTLAELFGSETAEDPMARVLSSAGDPLLGGDDFDREVYELAVITAEADLAEAYGIHVDLREQIPLATEEEIILMIESIKKTGELSGFSWTLDLTLPDKKEKIAFPLTIGKECFVRAFEKIYLRTKNIVADCLKGQNINSIDKLVLIGGSTRLQLLRDRVMKDFKMPVYLELNPDEAVALGAAVYTSILCGETKMRISDVLPQSIGIECITTLGERKIEGRFSKVIVKNTPLPASAEIELNTTEPNQETAILPVYQGEDSIAENNLHIGTVVLDIPPKPELQTVKAILTINASGVLNVSLSVADEKISVVLQNILRPSTTSVSKRDAFAKRFEVSLRKFKDDNPEIYAKGMQLVEDFRSGKIDYNTARTALAELKNDTIVGESKKSVASTYTDFFGATVVEEDDNSALENELADLDDGDDDE